MGVSYLSRCLGTEFLGNGAGCQHACDMSLSFDLLIFNQQPCQHLPTDLALRLLSSRNTPETISRELLDLSDPSTELPAQHHEYPTPICGRLHHHLGMAIITATSTVDY